MTKYIDADKLWNRLISVSENDWVGFDTIDEVLSGMPAADVAEVRHGRWIHHQIPKCVECSICHTHWDGEMNYCPNCGAKMDEVEE